MVFFTGSYQVSQTVSYLAEILDKDGKLVVEYAKERPMCLNSRSNLDIFLEHHTDVSLGTSLTVLEFQA